VKKSQDPSLSPALRELLACWDEQLLSVWLDAQLGSDWQSHGASSATWPVPAGKPS
jgi:hypothetical protein